MSFFLDWTIILVPFAFSLAFIIPGTLLLYPLKLKPFETLTLGSGLGIALWAIQGFIFGFLNLRFLTFAYILTVAIIWGYLIVKKRSRLGKYVRSFFAIDILSFFLIVIGAVLALSAVWFMGVKSQDGLFFCCRGVPDAIYHLSLTKELINNFPPHEPGMSGVFVKNYHYLSNLVVADITRVFKLDFMEVQFRYINLFLVLIFGASAFVFSNILGLKKSFARWLVVFFFASGDILYILLFLRGRGLNFGVTILDDATKLLAGPPRAFSIVLFFCALCLFTYWIKKKSLYAGLLSALIFGTLMGFKVYTGIFAITGLSAVSVYFLSKRKFLMLLPLSITLLMTMIYVFYVNKNAGGLYFDGLARFGDFVQNKDLSLLKLYFFDLKVLNSGNLLLHFLLGSLFVVIYFFFLYGTTNLGILQTKVSLRLLPIELNIFLISGIIVSLLLGSFFLQTTGGSNTVQFIISAFIIGSVYAALSLYYWISKLDTKFIIMISVIVLLLTVPRALHESFDNFMSITTRRGKIVDNPSLDSLNYFKLQTPSDSVMLLDPKMAIDETAMYVSFLADRPQFLSGAGVLEDHGQNVTQRLDVVNNIFNSNNKQQVKQLLSENKIDYIYLPTGVNIVDSCQGYADLVYSKNNIRILKVSR